MHQWPYPDTELVDGEVVLSRYGASDADALFDALAAPAVWEHIPRAIPTDPGMLHEQVMANPDRITWVISVAGEVAGTTSFLTVADDPDAIEIGATMMGQQWWGTGLNARVKQIMIAYAWAHGADRVNFRTDIRNLRSAAAIAKLGAAQTGVADEPDRLRRDGSVRRSVYFALHRDLR